MTSRCLPPPRLRKCWAAMRRMFEFKHGRLPNGWGSRSSSSRAGRRFQGFRSCGTWENNKAARREGPSDYERGESVVENSHEYYNTGSAETQVPFRIDPEFENEIRPLRKDEFAQLRKNILTASEVYEPLVVWNGILVDGHHRWKVILEAKSAGKTIKFRVRYMDFVLRMLLIHLALLHLPVYYLEIDGMLR